MDEVKKGRPDLRKPEWDIDFKTIDVRTNWKLKMIEEHLKGVKWHQDCIERLEKEIIDIEKPCR